MGHYTMGYWIFFDVSHLMVLDTGATSTQIPYEFIREYISNEDSKKIENPNVTYSTLTYSGGIVRSVPVCIDKIKLCNTVIEDFYTRIDIDQQCDHNIDYGLIGLDLLGECSINIINGVAFVSEINLDAYRRRIIESCKQDDIPIIHLNLVDYVSKIPEIISKNVSSLFKLSGFGIEHNGI